MSEDHSTAPASEPAPRGRLEGKSILVTGAGTGFGAQLAILAAREGARAVGVHYNRSRAGAESTAERVREIGPPAHVLQADIGSRTDITRVADEVFAEFGGLDILVNNAGDVGTDQMSWRDLDEASVDRVIQVDIKGLMLMLHEFGVRMLDQGHGSIVNIGSTVVVQGSPRAPQYAASKYALLGLTKSYARALAPTVRVNAYGPGFMATEATLAREDWKAGRGDELIAQTPLGRIPPPEDLAPGALFLASDDARHMTGGFLVSDGGRSMIGA